MSGFHYEERDARTYLTRPSKRTMRPWACGEITRESLIVTADVFLMVYTYSKGPTSMKHRRNRDLLSAFAIEITQICMLDFGDFSVFSRYVSS